MTNTVYNATKTLEAIETAVAHDQGKLYRYWLGKVIPHIGDAYRQDEDPFRSHMGASGIGDDCGRAIWYNFRWATLKQFSGTQLRLFNRGHLEEARFIAMLLAAGVGVYQHDQSGNQFRISHAGGHFGGSGDGILTQVPDAPSTPYMLGEFKTLSTKYSDALRRNGVRAEKFTHYVQMNIYMRKMDLPMALYLSVDKNTDVLYGEIVPLNVEVADEYLLRATTLIASETPPVKINASPSWFKCKYCDHREVCHFNKPPVPSCRSCMFAKPWHDGTWVCTNASSINGVVDKAQQLSACQQYVRAF